MYIEELLKMWWSVCFLGVSKSFGGRCGMVGKSCGEGGIFMYQWKGLLAEYIKYNRTKWSASLKMIFTYVKQSYEYIVVTWKT